MKFHIFVLLVIILSFGNLLSASAQVDSVIGQITSSSTSESFAGGISGDGRFVVFESAGNLATDNPRNSDGNREIFLFDYAQRRIFQITDTKSVLTDTTKDPTFDNIKVDITNSRPVISNNGRWIAFGSNATTSTPAAPNTTNPGNFDANTFTTMTGTNPLTTDGNTEIWLYQVPAAPTVSDLSAGDEIAATNLASGTFTRVTNSPTSRNPVSGSTTNLPLIADDNHDVSIDDMGSAVSFTSTRDLIAGGNSAPANNDEIFTYIRASNTIQQITTTPRGSVGAPIYNANSTITNLSAGGWRVLFLSNANNPIVGMTGNNADLNEEIFFADLDASGIIGANKKQVTTTARTNPGDVVNILNYGRRMSRDGRYIAFDSYADLTGENGGTNQAGFATFVYDTTLTTAPLQRISVRSNSDSAASGGDLPRFPGFTDYDANRSPQTIVLQTRMNIRGSDGMIATTTDEGLNTDPVRTSQIYTTSPVFIPPTTPPTPRPFKRVTKFPTPQFFLASVQPQPSNSSSRMAFGLSQIETGTGNSDLGSEIYYFIKPNVDNQTGASLNFATGASRIAVSASPVPTPTATPTPSPTPTPTTTPSPTPTPTPQQPPAVQGVSPGMLAILNYNSGTNAPLIARNAVGSIDRRFTLPIELSGVTMTINGAAAGLKSVGQRQIVFVVPPGLNVANDGIVYPVVINNNGTVFKGNVTVVPARPDIFTNLLTPGPGGRARVFNVTNRVYTTEPFTITTFRLRGSRRVPSVLRVYLTGVESLAGTAFTIRIGSVTISGANVITNATLVEPGVYTVDFTLPATIAGAGDQPIVVSVLVNGVTYNSRLDDTAPRISIL